MVLRRLLDAPTSTLESLDVGCNPFDPSLSKSFATCLQNSSVLRHLDIGGAREGWKVSTVVDVQIHLVCALRDNQLLRRLNVPHIGNRTIREEQKALRRKVFREVLQVNHSLIELSGYNNGWFERNMLWMNREYPHPILSSIIKTAPFPAYLIKNLSGGILANALERTDDIAGIDGVFSLLRQVSDSIAADEDTRKRSKED